MVPFAFPPPPPPPPKALADARQADQSTASVRARGRGVRGSFRGRGNIGSNRGRPTNNRGSPHQYSTSLNENVQLPAWGNKSSQSNSQCSNGDLRPTAFGSPYQQFMPGSVVSYGGVGAVPPFVPNTRQTAAENISNLSTTHSHMASAPIGFDQGQSMNLGLSSAPAVLSSDWSRERGQKRKRELCKDSRSTFPRPRPRSPTSHNTSRSSHNREYERSKNKSGPMAHSKPQRQKVEVAPAVPSFGTPLPMPVPQISSHALSRPKLDDGASAKKVTGRRRATNQLGLTPKGDQHEDSEDDVDEESKLASSTLEASNIRFEYKGMVTSLGSATDLAAWIAERKSRYPTRARVEEKRMEATRRAQERAEAQKVLNDARRQDKERRQREISVKALEKKHNDNNQETQTEEPKKEHRKKKALESTRRALEKHLAKAEKLKKKLQEAEKSASEVRTNSGNAEPINGESHHQINISSRAALKKTDGGLSSVQEELLAVEIDALLVGAPSIVNQINESHPSEIFLQPTVDTFPELDVALAIDEQELTPSTIKQSLPESESMTPNSLGITNASNVRRRDSTPSTLKQSSPEPASNGLNSSLPSKPPSPPALAPLSPAAEPDADADSDSESSSDSDSTISTSSDSSSDSIQPTEATTHSHDPVPDDSAPTSKPSTKRICKFFAQHGHCKYGSNCRYAHETMAPEDSKTRSQKRLKRNRDDTAAVSEGQPNPRKTLFQRLVEQERKEEARLVLEAVKTMGSQGMLD